ncbi:hypothetical protein LXA43DRAFT_1058894 [Ganoderma leucocontextum]|nr:hypothetical protein LXA43DRAFT_1058894 [Ganoderma leucocontextum]
MSLASFLFSLLVAGVQYYIDCAIRHVQYLPWAVTFFWTVLAFPIEYYGDFHLVSFVDNLAPGCTQTAANFTSLGLLGIVFIRGGQVIADAIVIGVTWKATHYARSEESMCFLTTVTFRHGTLYFIILLVLNILHTIFISSR